MTQADNANALRMSLDPDEGPTAAEQQVAHPSYTQLRAHAMLCERCAVGADCPTGKFLTLQWGEVRTRIEASGFWDAADQTPL